MTPTEKEKVLEMLWEVFDVALERKEWETHLYVSWLENHFEECINGERKFSYYERKS